MKKFIFIVLLLPSVLLGQNSYTARLQQVIKDIEKNYSGFSDKVEHKQDYYSFFKAQLLADSIRNIEQLKDRINTYLDFFEDLHLYSYTSYFDEGAASTYLEQNRYKVFQFNKLDSVTCYLKIGSFSSVELVDSLINATIDILSKTKNLIIDIRDNGGGGDAAFKPVLPILATNDIRLRNVEFLATPANWDFFKNTAKVTIGPWNPDFEDQFIQAPWIKDHSLFLNGYTYSGTNEYPKHVAVLVNRKVGSAGEQFVFCAKQSFKVKLFGENTGGFFDYSNCRHFEVIKDSLYISAPTTKVYGLPVNQIDTHGIAPDFYLKPEKQIEQILVYFRNWD